MSEVAQGAKTHKKLKWLAVYALLMIAFAATILWFLLKPEPSVIPKSISSAVNFPVIYPTKLPDGFDIDKESFLVSSNILSYKITTPSGDIVATQQEKPNQKIPIELPKTLEIETKLGRAVISRFENTKNVIITLTTDQSILFFNTEISLTDNQIRLLVDNLKSS